MLEYRLKRKDLVAKIYKSVVKFVLKYFGTEVDDKYLPTIMLK